MFPAAPSRDVPARYPQNTSPMRTSLISSRRRRSWQVFGAVGAAAISVLTGPIYGQTTVNWDAGAATGNWSDLTNWSTDALPGPLDTAAFNAQTGQQTIQLLGTTPIELAALTFSANTSSQYILQNGALRLNNINQTADDGNQTASTVTIETKNGGTDLLNANITSNTFQLQGKLTSGGIIKSGGGGLRLGTSGTAFNNAINGDIVINGGTLQASAGNTAGQNNPLGGTGKIVIGASGVTLSLTSSNLTVAGNAGTYDFVRDIVANNNNLTLNVDRAAGLANGGIMQAGMLTMGNATLTVNGGNGFQARLDGLTVNSGATTILGINNNSGGGQHLRLDSLIGDATTTVRKDGGQIFYISASAPAFSGNLVLNGGTTQVEANAVTNALTNSAGVTFMSGSTLNLRSDTASDYAVNVKFAPGVITSTISADRLSSDTSIIEKTLSLGDVNASGGTLTLSSGNGYTIAVDSITVNAGATAGLSVGTNGNGVVTTPVLTLPAGSILNKTGSSTLVLTGDNSATAGGAINLRAGTITASVAGALGTGLVTVGNTTATTDGFLTDASRLNWNAVGASANATGVDARAVAGGVIDLNVTPAATDVFDVQADGRIQGTAAQLSALTIGGNLTVAENAIIVHENAGAAQPTVAGLTNNASLFYGIAATANTLPTIGVGTPWKGISGDNATRTIQGENTSTPAVISINGGDNNPNTIEATFQSMFDSVLNLGTTTANDGTFTWSSTAANGEKVTLAIRGTLGISGLGRVPGGRVAFNDNATVTNIANVVDKVIVQGGSLLLMTTGTLGGVPVEIQNGGSLDINNLAGNLIDGNVNVKSGGVLYFNDNQLLGGTGTITIEHGGKLDISGSAPANILSDSTQKITWTGTNHTVRFSADNVVGLDAAVPDDGATFVISGGAATSLASADNFAGTTLQDLSISTQAGLSTNGGVITNDGTSRGLISPLTIGANGATFAASRSTNLVIGNDVITTGPINVGSATAIDGRDKGGNTAALTSLGFPDPFNSTATVFFGGKFQASSVTAAPGTSMYLLNADTTITGDINFNGNVLYLDGGGSTGTPAGELTTKIANGTLASRIVLGNYARTEMKLNLASDSNATVLQVNTPFVIKGDVNPQDNRTIYVSRNSGTNTRVDFTDVTVAAGAAIAFDEDNTDVSAALKLEGNATAFTGSANDSFNYLSISRASSLPAYNGTNPIVLTQGRINSTGISGFNNANSNVFGKIAEGVEVNIVRGQLYFLPGSSLDGVVRTQTALLGGDSFVLSTSNGATTDTSIGGIGRIELGRSGVNGGTPEDFEVRGTEVASGTAPLHTHTGEIRVVDDGTSALDGVIRANRHNDSTVSARVQVDNVTLAAGATVQLTNSNAIPLVVDKVSLLGSTGTIETAATGVTINTVNAGTNAVTFTGAAIPTVNNPVTAGQVNVTNGSVNLNANVNSPVAINTGTATITGNVGGALTATNGNANITGNVNGAVSLAYSTGTFSPGFSNTATIGGPVNLDGGALTVANGTLDLGNNQILSTPTRLGAGLREMKITGSAFNEVTPNTGTVAKLGPVMAQQTTGWGSNETYVYTGQIFVPDNNGDGTGSFALAENFDDNVRIDIDGVTRLRNTVWNDSTGTGVLTLQSGWHDIEIRLGQGGGGAGPNANDGWNTTLGLGIDLTLPIDPAAGANPNPSPVMANFIAPLDNGTMNLFRTTLSSTVNIADDSTLKAAGVTNVGKINLNGFNSALELNASGGAVASSADEIVVGVVASGAVNIARAGDSLTVQRLSVSGSFVKTGAGKLQVTGATTDTSTNFGSIDIQAGELVMNGSVGGMMTVLSGGKLSGSGTVGTLTLMNGGTIAPGNSPGVLNSADLTLNGGTLAFEFNGRTVGTQYDQINVTGMVSLTANTAFTLSLGFIPAVGDTFTIINNDDIDALNRGTFALSFGGTPLTEGALFSTANGVQFRITYAGGIDNNDVVLTTTIPEPASVASLIGGVGMLLGMQRFRRRK